MVLWLSRMSLLLGIVAGVFGGSGPETALPTGCARTESGTKETWPGASTGFSAHVCSLPLYWFLKFSVDLNFQTIKTLGH